MRLAAMVLLSLTLAGCSPDYPDGGEPGAGEASALNAAADQLDAEAGAARSEGLNPAAVAASRADRDRQGETTRP
ncbi:MAG TPA: hypothetical protein VJM09_07475 [Sphingobium sp.]|nr:hypothetical protein [Sphingobium sp.]